MLSNDSQLQIAATCARGFESYLSSELSRLGAQNITAFNGAVRCTSTFGRAMYFCLHSRLANKIGILLAEDHVLNENDVYSLGRRIPLDPWFSPTHTFCIRTHVNDDKFRNSMFLSLKLKDGLADHMREVWNQRASVDTERPDITLSLQVVQRRARVILELQGEPLNMRGYRRRQLEAPIRETLAASMIALSGWKPDMRLSDPMCGSGTFAIEAALQAAEIAPGIQRHFAFELLPFFSDYAPEWRRMRIEARDHSHLVKKTLQCAIFASDIDNNALEVAQNNAQTAGVADLIHFSRCNILDMNPVSGSVLTNPPYGERISVSGLDLPEFYYQMGRKFRTFDGADLTIIAPSALLRKNLHMRPDRRISTYNGALECEAAHYVLGKGKPDVR